MAEAIKEATGENSTLIESSGGVFEVIVDGSVIFSRKESKRFPELRDILDKLG